VGLFYTAPEPTRMVYPHWWSHISCRSSAGQGKFAGQRPTFYHCATLPCTGNVKYATITYSHKTDMPILSAHSKTSLGQLALEPGTSFSFLSLIVGTAFSALTLLAGRHITVMLQRIGHMGIWNNRRKSLCNVLRITATVNHRRREICVQISPSVISEICSCPCYTVSLRLNSNSLACT